MTTIPQVHTRPAQCFAPLAPACERRLPPPLAAILCFLAFAAGLCAQSVRWEPSGGSLPVGQVTEIQLIFENCEPKEQPRLPRVAGLTLELRGNSQNVSMVNFNVTKSIIYSYAALLSQNQPVEIPAFSVETDKGSQRVEAAHFESGQATVGQSGVSVDAVANARFTTPQKTVWAGEVFPLTYTLSVTRRYLQQLASDLDWTSTPLAIEDWSKPEVGESTARGDQLVTFTYRTRGYTSTSGALKLQPATQMVNLIKGYSAFGFFQQAVPQQQAITSDQLDLFVRPLPQPAPPGFSGAVGQFKLVSKVVPEHANVGEPVTWTLELSGTGNWPEITALPGREASKDFEVVQPQPKRVVAPGKLFETTLSEDAVLMPKRAGSYTLGSVSFTYFDPKSGSYKTLTTKKTTVTITESEKQKEENEKAAITLQNVTPGATAAAAPALPTPPAPPAALPGDPLDVAGSAPAPLSLGAVVALSVGLAVAIPLLCWLILAWRRAAATDPLKPRREARKRLAATLAGLQETAGKPRDARVQSLLLAWQRDAATLWGIDRAAPTASLLQDKAGSPEPAAWEQLWQEADRALYSTQSALPADWHDRAAQALAAKRVKAFSPATLFLRRNLAPFLGVALALLIGTATMRAAPGDDYRRGEFATAEKVWRAAVAKDPSDWAARHNLGLALFQQDQGGEAAAYWASAFVQQPRNPSVRRHFILGCEKGGYSPAWLGAFAQPRPLQDMAQLASPAEWQYVLIGAGALVAAAFALCLIAGYGWRSRWWKSAAWSLLAVAVILAAAATLSLRAYGPAVDARAALVWRIGSLRSIPTEADTTQKTTSLSAGSIGIVDGTFLGWVRLSFDDGATTGWVRKEDVVMLWR